MKNLQATFQIVTPMFLGGADQKVTSIRPASIKGALRFWWRALNWSKHPNLQELREKEAELFGAAASDKVDKDGNPVDGQGKFLMRVIPNKTPLQTTKETTIHKDFSSQTAARYLGYGLMEAFDSNKTGAKAGQLTRDCINEGQSFVVELLFRKEIDESVKEALIAFGLLGGLGSRTRKGMGSIALQTMRTGEENIWIAPKNNDEYQKEIKRVLNDCNVVKPAPYSAFHSETRVDWLLEESNPFTALNTYGTAMMMYRSWGNGGKVLGKESEKKFQNDHDWYREREKVPSNFHPRRIIFGLPHNYSKHEKDHVNPENYERRSSPLFLHIHKIENKYVGISILMKSDFLPKNEKIKAGKKPVDAKIEWDVLTDFLDGLVKETEKPRFPKKQLLWGKK